MKHREEQGAQVVPGFISRAGNSKPGPQGSNSMWPDSYSQDVCLSLPPRPHARRRSLTLHSQRCLAAWLFGKNTPTRTPLNPHPTGSPGPCPAAALFSTWQYSERGCRWLPVTGTFSPSSGGRSRRWTPSSSTKRTKSSRGFPFWTCSSNRAVRASFEEWWTNSLGSTTRRRSSPW